MTTPAARIGRYPVSGMLGSGSFGTVYLGVDPESGDRVAVKVLDRSGADATAEVRAEADALARVRDPHCVRVREVIDEPGLTAIVTDLVDGAPLRAVLDRAGRMSGPQALDVLRGALQGLVAVHAAGLAHGDLKPDNILVDRAGVSKLIDFGLAASPVDGAADDGGAGSPGYLSPEQIRGRGASVRSDLYACAVMLFELLAGRRPFLAGTQQELLGMHLLAAVPDLRASVPEAGDALADLCLRGMAKDPAQRPQTAAEFLAALEDAARRRYGSAWAGAGLGAGLGAAVTALLGVGGAGSGAGAGGTVPVAAGGAPAASPIASSGHTATTAVARGASRLRPRFTQVGLGGGKAGVASIGAVVAVLATAAVVVAVKHQDHSTAGRPPVAAPARSTDVVAAYITASGADESAYVARRTGSRVRIKGVAPIARTARSVSRLDVAATADGRYIAANDSRHITLLRATDPNGQRTIDCDCSGIGFRPDNTLATLTGNGAVVTYRIVGDGLTLVGSRRITGVTKGSGGDTLFSDSRVFAADADHAYVELPHAIGALSPRGFPVGGVFSVDLHTGAAVQLNPSQGTEPLWAMSADGRYLAVVAAQGEARCTNDVVTVVDLSALGRVGAKRASTTLTGPDRSISNLYSLTFEGTDLVAGWTSGSAEDCGRSKTANLYRAGIGSVGGGSTRTPSWRGYRNGVGAAHTVRGGQLVSVGSQGPLGGTLRIDDTSVDTGVVHVVVLNGHAPQPVRTSSSSPSKPAGATEVVTVKPVTADGHPAAGWTVDDKTGTSFGVDCSRNTRSPDAPTGNVYYCGGGASAAETCWPTPQANTMLCVTDPYSRKLMKITVDKSPTGPAQSSGDEVFPLGLKLDNGLTCHARWDGSLARQKQHPDYVGHYFCGDGFTLVWAPPTKPSIDKSAPLWTVRIGTYDGSLTTHSVVEGVYTGAA